MTTTTPDMGLVLPDVSITAGPQWATLLNAAFAVIDGHTHQTGSGVQISPAGLNISSDLTFNDNNATNLRTVRLFPNNTFSPVGSDKTCLYALGGELYYIDAIGNNVQITLNGFVDVAGAISALSIKDSAFFIQYFGDTSRQFRFNVSAIPASTTRILSVPDSGSNDSFVTANATQTLTAKTLTAPIIASINTGSGTTFSLPAADGTNGQVLSTNGSAALTFITAATTVGNVAANDSNVVFTNAANRSQICNPSTARTYTMPTTAIVAGDTWTFVNRSNFLITLNSSGANLIGYVNANSTTTLSALVNTPTTAGNWKIINQAAETLKGDITGTSPAAGFVGEIIQSNAGPLTVTHSGFTPMTSITLSAGNWIISATFLFYASSTSTGSFASAISTTSGSGSGTIGLTAIGGAIEGTNGIGTVPAYYVSITGSTTYYANFNTGDASDSSNGYASLVARRIS